jgi:asparagine synthase (glutamine-hydrolysing)
LDEEKFNQQKISELVRNILTLRYDSNIKSTLPKLSWNDFQFDEKSSNMDFLENTILENIEQHLDSSSIKEISIALSGGIDSTLVLAFLRKIKPELKISSISVKFAESNDETNIAKNIADHFESQHEIIYLENYLEELPKAISIVGFPFWDTHWYYVAKNTKTKLLASGDGGDELFGGYTFRYSKFLSLIDSSSSPLEKTQAYLKCHERDWVPNQENIFSSKINFSWNSINSIFLPFFENSLNPLSQVFLADYNGKLLHNFAIVNGNINKFFNLESVTPLLQPKLIKYAASLNPKFKYDLKTNQGKLPLRSFLKKFNVNSLIPNEKYGFSVNTLNLWKSFGKELCEQYLDNARIVEDKLIDKKWITSNIDRAGDDVRYINKFLGLLALEIWYRIFISKDLNSEVKLT